MNKKESKYDLFFDGAATKEKYRLAAFGFVLYLNGKEIDRGWGQIGRGIVMNELVAELQGLSSGLDSFVQHWNKPNATLNIFGDSRIALGRAVIDPVITFKLKEIRKMGIKVRFSWIPRNQNEIANALAHKLNSLA